MNGGVRHLGGRLRATGGPECFSVSSNTCVCTQLGMCVYRSLWGSPMCVHICLGVQKGVTIRAHLYVLVSASVYVCVCVCVHVRTCGLCV